MLSFFFVAIFETKVKETHILNIRIENVGECHFEILDYKEEYQNMGGF